MAEDEDGKAWIPFQVTWMPTGRSFQVINLSAINLNDFERIKTVLMTEEGRDWRRMRSPPPDRGVALFARVADPRVSLVKADHGRLRSLGFESPYDPEPNQVARRIFADDSGLLEMALQFLWDGPGQPREQR